MKPWHTMTAAQTAAELGCQTESGLSVREVLLRQEKYGSNSLHIVPKRPLWLCFLEQLTDPMILVLLGAAFLSLLASRGENRLDAVIILVIVIGNAVLSLVQEHQAAQALEALRGMAAPKAQVLRGGSRCTVPAAQLVPGDVIFVETGDLVPADARILRSSGLKADESALTGESVPVEKHGDMTLPPQTAPADRANLIFGSTVITAGHASALVVETGMRTQVGQIAGLLLDQKQGDTPLQRKMGEISKTLSLVCLCACGLMFGIGLLRGKELLSMFLIAVSLAVAAIPEGLPAIVTIVLSLGVQQMAREKAVVKKLPAVETLGCATVICTDKTGTLTCNHMTVTDLWSIGGTSDGLALSIGALCSNVTVDSSGTLSGDPTETAIVSAALRKGIRKAELDRDFPRQGEIPFDARRKLMSTLHPAPGGGIRVLVKGAPDCLLRRCTRYQNHGIHPLTPEAVRQIEHALQQLSSRALRVIALAYGERPTLPHTPLNPDDVETDLIFVGLVGMMDPPRSEAASVIDRCRQAGIRTVMVTGDHKTTAMAIARQLHLLTPDAAALTGLEIDAMSEEEFAQAAAHCAVFARVTPEHKLRIVRALQADGQVVAMTGDGANDAPALKAADIGCAMGKGGTDVAREAADMVLLDDRFATIVSAVEQGRGIYANIRKSIHYLLSCNIGELLTVFLATLFNFRQVPLTAVQLLWLNLVTDSLPALALGVEPVEEGIMSRPPRNPREPLFSPRFSLRLLWQGALVGMVTLCAYFLGESVLADPLRADGLANTMAFSTLTLSQLFHAYDVRSEQLSLLRLGVFTNSAMNRAFLIGVALQLSVLIVPPLRAVFSTVALRPAEWLPVVLLSLLPAAVCEAVKHFSAADKGERP